MTDRPRTKLELLGELRELDLLVETQEATIRELEEELKFRGNIDRLERCPDCEGSGYVKLSVQREARSRCSVCGGLGVDRDSLLRRLGLDRKLKQAEAVLELDAKEIERRDRAEESNVLFRRTLKQLTQMGGAADPLVTSSKVMANGEISFRIRVDHQAAAMAEIAQRALEEKDRLR